MKINPVLLAIFFCWMSACVRPSLDGQGSSRLEITEINVVRSYFLAINTKNQASLSKVLAENVEVSAGQKSWGKVTELANRVEAWTRDPKYTVEITSITIQGGIVKARVMVNYESHGSRVRQEIENTFNVQHNQITQAILSP